MTDSKPIREEIEMDSWEEKAYYLSDLKLKPRKQERLVCKNCSKPPHWFGKACTEEIEAKYNQ